MTRSDSVFHFECEFDAFLFSAIGESRDGMPLSVVSALARMDFDPWDEAANLARLPGNKAIERLAALIRSLPDSTLARRDPEPIAARLIGLLPRRVTVIAQAATLVGGTVGAKTRVIAICAVILVGLVTAQLIAIGFQPAGSTTGATAPVPAESSQ